MSRLDRSKRFDLRDATPVEERPQIWVDGRQQPRFRFRPYVAVTLAMAKRDLLPDMIESEARLRDRARRIRAGEADLTWTERLGRRAPEPEQLAQWVDAVAAVVAGARSRLDRKGEEVEVPAHYAQALRPAAAGPVVRPRRARDVLAAAQRPADAAPEGLPEAATGDLTADAPETPAPEFQAARVPADDRPIGLSEEDLAPLTGNTSTLTGDRLIEDSPPAPAAEPEPAAPPVAAAQAAETILVTAQEEAAPEPAAALATEAQASETILILAQMDAAPEPAAMDPAPQALAPDPDLAAIRFALESQDEGPDSDEIAPPPAPTPAPDQPSPRLAPLKAVQDPGLPAWLKDWQPPQFDLDDDIPEPPARILPASPAPAPVAKPRGPGLMSRAGRRIAPLARAAGRGLAALSLSALRALGRLLRPIGILLVNNLARLAHVTACWALLSLLMIIAVPKGAFQALIYHLDGGNLAEWS